MRPTTHQSLPRRFVAILIGCCYGGTLWFQQQQQQPRLIVSALAPVSTLMSQHQGTIDALKAICTAKSIDLTSLPYSNDVFFLRYCLSDKTDHDATALLERSLEWRLSPVGKRVTTVASMAVEQAMSSSSSSTTTTSKWDNTVVFLSAPHSTEIRPYITPQNCLTTTTAATPTTTPNLVYCIRAGGIDDTALMKAVTVDQLVEFFLYVKEVNGIVSDARSRTSDQLLTTITCNDLAGVKLIGGSADFRKALSQSSTIAATIYPASYTGPTLLLNLPTLLAALVSLFTPLFPESVKARLKFSRGVLLKDVTDLTLVATSSTSKERIQFTTALDGILNGK